MRLRFVGEALRVIGARRFRARVAKMRLRFAVGQLAGMVRSPPGRLQPAVLLASAPRGLGEWLETAHSRCLSCKTTPPFGRKGCQRPAVCLHCAGLPEEPLGFWRPDAFGMPAAKAGLCFVGETLRTMSAWSFRVPAAKTSLCFAPRRRLGVARPSLGCLPPAVVLTSTPRPPRPRLEIVHSR